MVVHRIIFNMLSPCFTTGVGPPKIRVNFYCVSFKLKERTNIYFCLYGDVEASARSSLYSSLQNAAVFFKVGNYCSCPTLLGLQLVIYITEGYNMHLINNISGSSHIWRLHLVLFKVLQGRTS